MLCQGAGRQRDPRQPVGCSSVCRAAQSGFSPRQRRPRLPIPAPAPSLGPWCFGTGLCCSPAGVTGDRVLLAPPVLCSILPLCSVLSLGHHTNLLSHLLNEGHGPLVIRISFNASAGSRPTKRRAGTSPMSQGGPRGVRAGIPVTALSLAPVGRHRALRGRAPRTWSTLSWEHLGAGWCHLAASPGVQRWVPRTPWALGAGRDPGKGLPWGWGSCNSPGRSRGAARLPGVGLLAQCRQPGAAGRGGCRQRGVQSRAAAVPRDINEHRTAKPVAVPLPQGTGPQQPRPLWGRPGSAGSRRSAPLQHQRQRNRGT